MKLNTKKYLTGTILVHGLLYICQLFILKKNSLFITKIKSPLFAISVTYAVDHVQLS